MTQHSRSDRTSISLHSFRHTFADTSRRGKLPSGETIRDDDISWILGHANGPMTSRYGRGQHLAFLSDNVEAVTYPEVDIGSIRWELFKTTWGGNSSGHTSINHQSHLCVRNR